MAIDLGKVKNEGVSARINEIARTMPIYSGIPFWSTHYLEPRDGADAATDGRIILNADPAKLETLAAGFQVQHTLEMIREVGKGYSKVLEETSPEYVVSVADRFIGDANYKALTSAIANNNGVSAAFVAIHPEAQILTNMVAIATEEAVMRGAKNAQARIRSTELVRNHVINPETGLIDMVGGARYAVGQVNQLSEDERTQHYADAGFAYAAMKDPTHFQKAT